MRGLTAVSLFAGIGGFDLSFQRAGIKVAAAVEIDPACRTVLAGRFPETVLFDDVRKVTGDQLRAAGFVPGRGVLAAGWPCQGNSVAGRGRGLADPRSGLWRHVVRLLAETRPRWFLGENVPGLLVVNRGLDFRAILRDLDDLGYGVAWRVLDAQWFGVPQRRRRVFLAGCLGDGTAPVELLLEPESSGRHPAAGGPARAGTARSADRCAERPGQVTVSTLQGGGQRGSRIDAEGAAGGHLIAFDAAQITHPQNRANPRPGNPAPSVVAAGQPMIAGTLRSHVRPGSNSTGGVVPLQAGNWGGNGSGIGGDNNPSFTLDAHGSPKAVAVPIAFNPQSGGSKARLGFGDTPTALQASQVTAVHNGTAVRRLTPRECERLQGFPDDWTAGQADAARYRELGNAVAVPVVAWLAARLAGQEAA